MVTWLLDPLPVIIPAWASRASASTPRGCFCSQKYFSCSESRAGMSRACTPSKKARICPDLRQRFSPRSACAVFHAPSSLLPPSPSVRRSPCRSCLLIFFPPPQTWKTSRTSQDVNESELPRTHTHARTHRGRQKERRNKSLRQLNSLTATETATG